jgi:hypothetical protein
MTLVTMAISDLISEAYELPAIRKSQLRWRLSGAEKYKI